MTPLALYQQLRASGMDEATALAAAGQFETSELAKAEARYEALLDRLNHHVETAADRKKERDRARIAAKREAEKRERQSRDNGDSRATTATDGDKGDAKDAPAPTYVRGENNLSRLVDTGINHTTLKRESVGADDWPEGDAKRHAELLVAEAASHWLDPQRTPTLITTAGRIDAWRRDGASWRFDVLPMVTVRAKARGSPISTWKFFDAAIAQSIADNRRALEIPTAANGPRHERPDQPSAKRSSREDNLARAFAASEAVARSRAVG